MQYASTVCTISSCASSSTQCVCCFIKFTGLGDLNKKQVVKEALRMASVVQWFPRVALQDCEIEGLYIIIWLCVKLEEKKTW